jgi:hypothetical protein
LLCRGRDLSNYVAVKNALVDFTGMSINRHPVFLPRHIV